MKGFQKGITLGGRVSGSFHILGLQKWFAKNLQHFGIWVEIQDGGHERFPKRYNTWEVGPFVVFIFWVCKNGLQKFCKFLASELVFKLGVMRGFKKGITLGGRTSRSVRKVFGWVVVVVGWILVSPCLPTEAFRDISVTFLWHFRDISVIFRWRLRRQESVGRQVATIEVICLANFHEFSIS